MNEIKKLLGLDDNTPAADVIAAVAALKSKVDAAEKANAQRAEDEREIGEKRAKGLTREQAIVVIERQKAWVISEAAKAAAVPAKK